MKRPAIFLDRDGTLNVDTGYPHRSDQLTLLPGVIEGLRRLHLLGFALVIVTNQSGVARGYFSEASMHDFNRALRDLLAQHGIPITAVYACPYHPEATVERYRRESQLRKPAPGMLLQAATEHNLDLPGSFVIGDKLSDVQAGFAAGCRTVLLAPPNAAPPPGKVPLQADFVAGDLLAAAQWISGQPAKIAISTTGDRPYPSASGPGGSAQGRRGLNVGVFIPNWVGDVAMCTPALRALRKHLGPSAHITGIMRPYVADVLAGTPWLDNYLLYDHRSKLKSERSWAALSSMRKERFDMIVLFTNSLRTAILAKVCGAPTRVGYVRYGRGPLLSHKIDPPRLGRKRIPYPAIDSYLDLVYALGGKQESPRLELATSAADEARADQVWNRWKLPPGDQVVVLNSSGAYGGAKLWPSEHFAKLARQIVQRQDLAALVVCGPNERQQAREIVRLAGDPRVVSLADEPISIGLTKACIRRSRLMVTTDSGPRFFAVAFGIPVITLFGPTDPDWTRTHYDGEVYLQHSVPCGPCAKRVCPLAHHDCMRLLSVERVYEAVLNQLSVSAASAA